MVNTRANLLANYSHMHTKKLWRFTKFLQIVFIVLKICIHISFHSKYVFQIRNYHEKQFLVIKMIPNETLGI